jgi:hypothetical protein
MTRTRKPEPTGQPELMFGSLPAEVFRPLAGASRLFYADLLEFLDAEVFGATGEIMSKKSVIAAIREFIDRQSREITIDSEDIGLSSAELQDQDPRCFFAYRRLLQTGWLLESRDRYRVIVDLDPNACVLLQALLDIKSGRLRSYGGAVLNVLTLLESAKVNPLARSENVREAAISARRPRLHDSPSHDFRLDAQSRGAHSRPDRPPLDLPKLLRGFRR